MARPKLTEQQKKRIAHNSQAHTQLGDTSEAMQGLVVTQFGQTVEVEFQDKVYRCYSRKNLGSIVVGDEVLFQAETETDGVILTRLPRLSVLIRSTRYKPSQELAANIDQVLIMLGVLPEPIPYYLDQYLIAAEIQKLPSIIVVNKLDLLAANSPTLDWLKTYPKMAYPMIFASIRDQVGLDELGGYLKGKNSILVGQSGVGKSSFINSLTRQETAKTANISIANSKGRHTTTNAKLYHLACGGNIIDSPGVREFGIVPKMDRDLIEYFVDLRQYNGHCKYRNCLHQHEKVQDCAILTALEKNEIAATRLDSFYRIRSEIQS